MTLFARPRVKTYLTYIKETGCPLNGLLNPNLNQHKVLSTHVFQLCNYNDKRPVIMVSTFLDVSTGLRNEITE